MPAVAADHEVGADRQRALRAGGAYANDAAVVFDQIDRFGLHVQVECFVAFAVLGEEIEKIPLRHQRDEFAVRRQVREIDDRQRLVADLHAQAFQLLMRQLEEFVEQAELLHDFERREMDGVAAEIAKEVGVLFQHHHIDAGARQQKAEHHPGRSAAGDAAARFDRQLAHRCMAPAGRALRPGAGKFNLCATRNSGGNARQDRCVP